MRLMKRIVKTRQGNAVNDLAGISVAALRGGSWQHFCAMSPVGFLHARSRDGRPYEDSREPLADLTPLR